METTENVVKLKERLAAAETKAAMLDLLPMPIIRIDKDSIVTYINPAGAMALGLFQQDDVVGMDCHDVLQTPQCQTGECLCYQTVHANDVITGETILDPAGQKIPIQFTGIPMKDQTGNITGGLVFMLDISEELELIEKVLALIGAMKEGDLTVRGDVERFEGNARRVMQGVNDLLDDVIGPLNVIADYIDRIAKGSIPQKIIDEYKGDFNNIKNNLNGLINTLLGLTNTVHAIAAGDLSDPLNKDPEEGDLTLLFEPLIEVTGQLVGEIRGVSKAVIAGRLDVRGDVNKFQGEFAKAVRSVNSMLDAVTRPLNIVAEYVERIASGNIPGRITDEYKGDFNEIKKHLNQCVDVVNSLVTETVRLTEATSEGLLNIRGDAGKFQGNFAKIVHGINATLDAVAGPLNTTVEYVDQIAKGNIPGKIIDDYKGDFHKIKNALNSLIDRFQEITDIANAIAHGDMSVEANKWSEDDVRIIAFQKIKATISQLIREIHMLKEAAVEGQLDIRADANKFPGDFAKIIQGTNATLDAVVGPLNGVAEYIERIANGNIPAKMTDEYKGDFRKFKNSINCCLDAINDVNNEVANMAEAVARGDLDRRANLSKYKGDWAKIVKGLNATTENMVTPIRDIGSVLNRMAAGEITAHVTFRYQGDYNLLKGACHELGGQLQDMRDVLVHLKTAAMNGQFDARGNVQQFKGEFAGMVQGVNDVLNAVELESQTRILRESERRLQQQQEELWRTNKELKSQTHVLRESEQRLQRQQEELRRTNKELSRQIKDLEKHQITEHQKNLTLEKAQRLIEEKVKALEQSSKHQPGLPDNMTQQLQLPLNNLEALLKLLEQNRNGNLTEKQDNTRVNLEEMSLRGVADYIEQNFTRMAVERGLYLKVGIAKGLPDLIRTDRQRVEQIVQNLLSNALKFTNQGGVSVRIARPAKEVVLSRSGLTLHNTIALSVSDTGIGIPEEEQRVICGAFQWTGDTAGQRASGAGSGLSILWKLTTLLGGEIQLHSQEGKGSTFSLFLPEDSDSQQAGKRNFPRRPRPDNVSKSRTLEKMRSTISSDSRLIREVSVSPSSRASRPRTDRSPVLSKAEGLQDDRLDILPESKTMLIIENDSEFANTLLDLARERGFKGLVANGGAAGLQLAYQYTPGAIILNIGLLDVDGWMIMEKLKANADTRNIPVHFISTQDRTLEAVKMGTIEYLTKPVTSAEALSTAFKKIEESLENPIKSLLIVESDEPTQVGMVELLGGDNIEILTAATGKDAYQLLQTGPFDCMVLDLGLPDISGFELLNMIKENLRIAPLPIIVYTAKELTKKEQKLLKKHSESSHIEGIKSQDRLLDEVASFLRQIESELPPEQQEKLRTSYDRDTVLNGKTLLLVDGDMRNIPALTNMFEEKGLHVLFVENGKEALKQLNTRSDIDLVLMDMMMPGMNGRKVTHEIRKQPRFKRLPIIAMTERALKDERQKCSEVGINDYLSKPIDTDKLLSVLRVWLY